MAKRQAGLKSLGKRSIASAANTATRKGHSSSHDTRAAPGKNQRSNATAKVLKMYSQKPDRAKMRAQPKEPMVRIEPGRKWFNNTRIVSQDNLAQFRETLAKVRNNPRSILVKATKLPVSLFDHSGESKQKRASNLLSISSYAETFSAKRRQRQARIDQGDLASLVADVNSKNDEYAAGKDRALIEEIRGEQERAESKEAVMLKGTSRRIWGELYKVVDSSDVLVQVLDIRDPLGTRCYHLENHIKKDRPFKKMILLLNKCDLVPTWVTERWIKILSKEYPVVAFKASMKHPFGKRSLIGLLRQFAELMKNRKHVSVGLIGYPNTGKSSVINTLRGKKVCTAAPIPGETKVWQYVDLTSKVYLIDCPGIVAEDNLPEDGQWTSDELKVARGVVRAERLDCPEDYIDMILRLVNPVKFNKFYKIDPDVRFKTGLEAVEHIAVKWGKLGKGGEPNIAPVAIRIIQDLQRGKLPYFVPPPGSSDNIEEEQEDDLPESLADDDNSSEDEESSVASDGEAEGDELDE